MKHMVGFTCWESSDRLCWLMEGVVANFPAGSHVAFFFDACTDDSIDLFQSLRQYWLDPRYTVHLMQSQTEIMNAKVEDQIMRRFMETDCDVLHILQDDQRLNSPQPQHVEALLAAESKAHKVGVIGGREGHVWMYQNFISSAWSTSDLCALPTSSRLPVGQWTPRPFINPAPVILPRQVIQEVGYYDPHMIVFYVTEEYCKRATDLGFTNYVLGTDITHVKFGRGKNSWNATRSDFSAHDLAYLRAKYPGQL